ncbi:helix-turn-helix domain-containing protein [Mycolicibacterium mageritense]|uniref:helix-turn-helix domain-containing protein n=1 Tax=Mycolicibacterium mageritense TaxID=53462 RepID=UPI0035B650A5
MKKRSVPEPERTRLLAAAQAETAAASELRAAVHAAHDAGGSIREIAGLLGVSTNTIQRWLKEN